MSNIKRTEAFAERLWKIILSVATDNAVRLDDDTGFNVLVTKEDIRAAVECKRVNTALFDLVEEYLLAKAPYLTASRVRDGLKIKVAPLLSPQSDFDVTQLAQQANVIELINNSTGVKSASGGIRMRRVLTLPDTLLTNCIYYYPDKDGKLAITVVGSNVGARLTTEEVIIGETHD